MMKKLQLILVCFLFFVLGSYSNIISKADTSLQGIGKILVTNPETGQTEVLFDSADQKKLKDSIDTNSIDISELKDFKEYQYEQNELFIEDTNLAKEQAVNALSALGGFSFIKDPEVIALVADSSIYKDIEGNFILANSTTGQSLLEDTSLYTTTIAEGNYYSTGADTLSPFSTGSGGDISFHSAAKNKTITVDNKCTAVLITTYSYADGNYACSDRSSVKVTGSGNSAKRVKKQAMCYYNKDAGQYQHNYIDVWTVDVNVGDTITSTTCTVWALF